MEHVFGGAYGEVSKEIGGVMCLLCHRCNEWIRESETGEDCVGYSAPACHVRYEIGESE